MSFIYNLIGWIKGSNTHTLIAGILYILSLNPVSAPLCLIEYFDGKRKIKNKLLFYTMAYILVFGMMFNIWMYVSADGSVGLEILVYTLIAESIGIILNFIAWKTSNKKAKIFAGIVYILGIFTVISAILCFISCKDNRKLPKAEEKAAREGIINN